MILLVEQRPGSRQENLHQLRHSSDDSERTQYRFLANIRVRRLHQFFNLRRQISSHLRRCDRTQRAEGEPHNKLGRTI